MGLKDTSVEGPKIETSSDGHLHSMSDNMTEDMEAEAKPRSLESSQSEKTNIVSSVSRMMTGPTDYV
jgi:hypothetical protein